MEIKKCARCGNFFETVNDVCNGCIPKDNKDVGKLKNFLNGYGYLAENMTRGEVSVNTGITLRNLNRFLQWNDFKAYNIPENLNNIVGEDVVIENVNNVGKNIKGNKKVLEKI